MGFMLPSEHAARLPRLFTAMALSQYLRYRASELVTSDGKVIGCALWAPPGGWHQSQPRQLLSLPRFIRALGPQLPTASLVASELARRHPSEPHWYLSAIGVDPANQGSGVGAALLRSRLAGCDQAGLPAYLESSKESNIDFYQRFGFAVTEQYPVAPGGPSAWSMWREPPG